MTKFNQLQNNFSSGELAPKLKSRTDVKEYFSGCETLENMVVLPAGGAARRPGTRFIFDQGGSSPQRIIPFKFSKTESYIVIIFLSAGLPTLSVVSLDGTGLSGSLAFTTTYMTDDDKEDIYGFNYAQSGDALFIVHRSGNMEPHVLKRTSANNFSLATYTNTFYTTDLKKILAQPFDNINETDITLAPNSGPHTGIIASDDYFTEEHVGSYIRYQQSNGTGAEGVYIITGYVSATEVASTELIAPAAVGFSVYWSISAFSQLKGFPRTVFIFEQRIVFGGTREKPDSLFFSKTGNVWQMMQDRLAQDDTTNVSGLGFFGSELTTDPFFVTISSEEVDEITWIGGFRDLLVGTLGGERSVTSETFLSATDIKIRRQTAHGGKNIQTVQIDNTAYFVSADGKKIRSFKYNDTNGSFTASDISLLNDTFLHHNVTSDFFDVEVSEMVYQRSTGIMWIRSTAGELIGLTVDSAGEVTGWHRHTLGGTDVSVLGLAPISRDNTGYEDLYLLVSRTINDSTEIYVEKIGPHFEETALFNTSTSDDAKPIYSDCAVVISGATEILGTEVDEEGLETEDGDILILE